MEDLSSETGIDFKNGDGPAEVHELLRELSEELSTREPDQPPTDTLMDILTRLAMVESSGRVVDLVTREPGRTDDKAQYD